VALKAAMSTAQFVKGSRGEASEVAASLLSRLEG